MSLRTLWLSTALSSIVIAAMSFFGTHEAVAAAAVDASATSTYITSWDSPILNSVIGRTVTIAFTPGVATTTNVTFTIRERIGSAEYIPGTEIMTLPAYRDTATNQWRVSWVTPDYGGYEIIVSSTDWPKTYKFGNFFVDNSTIPLEGYYAIAIGSPTPKFGSYVSGTIPLAANVSLTTESVLFSVSGDGVTTLLSVPAGPDGSPSRWAAKWDTTSVKNGTYYLWAKGVAGVRGSPSKMTAPIHILYVDNPTPTAQAAPAPASAIVDSTSSTTFKPENETATATSIDVDKSLVTVSATPCVPGHLLKTNSSAAVYYCGADGKRYVFANDKVYRTWYPVDPTVKTVSIEALASIPLGGNVTYRPGVKMIKIVSDPKTYAVSRGGTLRWVTSEAVAAALYGPDWNQKIDDVSDAFFVNYKLGVPITTTP